MLNFFSLGKSSNKHQTQTNGNNNARSAFKSSPEKKNGVMEEEESEDTDGSDERLSEDENFVNNFMNVRKTKLVDPGPSFNRVFAPTVDVSVSVLVIFITQCHDSLSC